MLPGSIVSRKIFDSDIWFASDVRSSEDVEWILNVARNKFKIIGGDQSLIEYYGSPKNIISAAKKYLIYGFNTAKTKTFLFQKSLYLGMTIFLILLATLENYQNLIFSILFILVILFRGVIRPVYSGMKLKDIFPYNWLIIGFFGLVLDIAKTPGYVFGAFLYPYKNLLKKFEVSKRKNA